jgi:2-dehydro-3-deoxyphosphogalactonate aldolase
MTDIAATYLEQSPLIAILRGVKPDEVIDYADAIVEAGWRCLEVPLNSPDPLASIEKLSAHFGDRVLIGAGTVRTAVDVENVAGAGGRVIVSPNSDAAVIRATIAHNMIPMPGFMTPTEAGIAYDAGARYLKLFPAGTGGPGHLGAVRAILQNDAKIIAVGGVSVDNLAEFKKAGAIAYGIGSEIYKPGRSLADVAQRARDFVTAAVAAHG